MKKYTHHFVSLMLAGLLAASPAFARTESSAAAHIAFDVPDAWVTTSQGTSVVVRAPTGGVAIEFHVVANAAQAEQDLQQLDRVLATRLQGLVWDGDASPVSQHGLRGRMRRGHGMINGTEVGFLSALMGHAGGGVLVIAWVNRASLQANLPTMVNVLNSVRAT